MGSLAGRIERLERQQPAQGLYGRVAFYTEQDGGLWRVDGSGELLTEVQVDERIAASPALPGVVSFVLVYRAPPRED